MKNFMKIISLVAFLAMAAHATEVKETETVPKCFSALITLPEVQGKSQLIQQEVKVIQRKQGEIREFLRNYVGRNKILGSKAHRWAVNEAAKELKVSGKEDVHHYDGDWKSVYVRADVYREKDWEELAQRTWEIMNQVFRDEALAEGVSPLEMEKKITDLQHFLKKTGISKEEFIWATSELKRINAGSPETREALKKFHPEILPVLAERYWWFPHSETYNPWFNYHYEKNSLARSELKGKSLLLTGMGMGILYGGGWILGLDYPATKLAVAGLMNSWWTIPLLNASSRRLKIAFLSDSERYKMPALGVNLELLKDLSEERFFDSFPPETPPIPLRLSVASADSTANRLLQIESTLTENRHMFAEAFVGPGKIFDPKILRRLRRLGIKIDDVLPELENALNDDFLYKPASDEGAISEKFQMLADRLDLLGITEREYFSLVGEMKKLKASQELREFALPILKELFATRKRGIYDLPGNVRKGFIGNPKQNIEVEVLPSLSSRIEGEAYVPVRQTLSMDVPIIDETTRSINSVGSSLFEKTLRFAREVTRRSEVFHNHSGRRWKQLKISVNRAVKAEGGWLWKGKSQVPQLQVDIESQSSWLTRQVSEFEEMALDAQSIKKALSLSREQGQLVMAQWLSELSKLSEEKREEKKHHVLALDARLKELEKGENFVQSLERQISKLKENIEMTSGSLHGLHYGLSSAHLQQTLDSKTANLLRDQLKQIQKVVSKLK